MQNDNNPLSPHLQIYKWQISSLLSITHRIVGVINILAITLICIWTLSLLVGENSYEICIALAGFDESQISVDIAQGVLMISASNNSKDESRNYLHKGIATRAFSKQFRLAETVEVEKANFHNGMLNICLFRKIPEAEKPKNIKINSAPRSKVSSIA